MAHTFRAKRRYACGVCLRHCVQRKPRRRHREASVADIHQRIGKTYPAVNVTTDEMAKNTMSTFELPLESVIDINDVSNYPLTVNAIRLDLGKSDRGKAYELLMPEFKAVYNTYGSVGSLNAESSSMRLYPNPVVDGVLNIAAEGAAPSASTTMPARLCSASRSTARQAWLQPMWHRCRQASTTPALSPQTALLCRNSS
ncbi:MAG: hypothetical protein L6U61_01380 [Bacteroidales bacterium]|nr:MAG: hypothetical protein L6U61_01380 [Bacteroidales bacterium]